MSIPADWIITSASGGLSNPPGYAHGGTWHVVGSRLTLTLSGPSGSNETMQVHVSSLSGSWDSSYPLN